MHVEAGVTKRAGEIACRRLRRGIEDRSEAGAQSPSDERGKFDRSAFGGFDLREAGGACGLGRRITDGKDASVFPSRCRRPSGERAHRVDAGERDGIGQRHILRRRQERDLQHRCDQNLVSPLAEPRGGCLCFGLGAGEQEAHRQCRKKSGPPRRASSSPASFPRWIASEAAPSRVVSCAVRPSGVMMMP